MCSERMRSPSPDWSLLPPELLHLIAHSHLSNPCDLLRFRSVCSRWRSSSAGSGSSSHHYLPWLLLPYRHKSPSLPFLNPSDLRLYSLPLPPPLRRPRKTVFASPHGFLIVIHKSTSLDGYFAVSLFNPFTGALISFPPLPPLAKSPSVRKALLSVDPAMLVAVLLHGKLAFCALGDADWTVADVGSSYGGHDLAYRGGRLYLASLSGLQVLRLEDLSMASYQLWFHNKGHLSVHLMVDSSSGDVLVLANYESGARFDVYKLDVDRNLLVRCEIGDRLFFVSRRQSLCVSGKGLVGLEEGSCGCSVSEDFLQAAPLVVYSLRAMDGCSLKRGQAFWQTPCMQWADWKDMMKTSWFIPKLC